MSAEFQELALKGFYACVHPVMAGFLNSNMSSH